MAGASAIILRSPGRHRYLHDECPSRRRRQPNSRPDGLHQRHYTDADLHRGNSYAVDGSRLWSYKRKDLELRVHRTSLFASDTWVHNSYHYAALQIYLPPGWPG